MGLTVPVHDTCVKCPNRMRVKCLWSEQSLARVHCHRTTRVQPPNAVGNSECVGATSLGPAEALGPKVRVGHSRPVCQTRSQSTQSSPSGAMAGPWSAWGSEPASLLYPKEQSAGRSLRLPAGRSSASVPALLTGEGGAWRGLRALGAARGGGGLLRGEPVTLASSHLPSLEQPLSQAVGHRAAFEGHLHPEADGRQMEGQPHLSPEVSSLQDGAGHEKDRSHPGLEQQSA